MTFTHIFSHAGKNFEDSPPPVESSPSARSSPAIHAHIHLHILFSIFILLGRLQYSIILRMISFPSINEQGIEYFEHSHPLRCVWRQLVSLKTGCKGGTFSFPLVHIHHFTKGIEIFAVALLVFIERNKARFHNMVSLPIRAL